VILGAVGMLIRLFIRWSVEEEFTNKKTKSSHENKQWLSHQISTIIQSSPQVFAKLKKRIKIMIFFPLIC